MPIASYQDTGQPDIFNALGMLELLCCGEAMVWNFHMNRVSTDDDLISKTCCEASEANTSGAILDLALSTV